MRRTDDAAGLGIGLCFGAAQRAQDGEGGGQVLEGVRFGPPAGGVEQLTQQQHRRVRLARTTASYLQQQQEEKK